MPSGNELSKNQYLEVEALIEKKFDELKTYLDKKAIEDKQNYKSIRLELGMVKDSLLALKVKSGIIASGIGMVAYFFSDFVSGLFKQ